MRLLGIIVNVALLAVYIYYGYAKNDVIAAPCIYGAGMFIWLLVVHIGICNTPTESSERYETWKKMLHSNKNAMKIRWASIGSIVYTYGVAMLFNNWMMGDTKWWQYIVVGIIVIVPAATMHSSFAKGNTLAKAKEHYEDVVKHLSSNYADLVKNVDNNITPDTPLLNGLVCCDRDMWRMVWVINDYVIKHKIGPGILENKAWNNFVKRCNDGDLKTDKQREVVLEGMRIAKAFCENHKTVGGMGVWIAEGLETKDREAAQENLG